MFYTVYRILDFGVYNLILVRAPLNLVKGRMVGIAVLTYEQLVKQLFPTGDPYTQFKWPTINIFSTLFTAFLTYW